MIKINYIDGSKWELSDCYIVDGWVDWEDVSLNIMNAGSDLCSFEGWYEFPKNITPGVDVLSLEDHMPDSVMVWKNPRYKHSLQISSLIANQRTKQNRQYSPWLNFNVTEEIQSILDSYALIACENVPHYFTCENLGVVSYKDMEYTIEPANPQLETEGDFKIYPKEEEGGVENARQNITPLDNSVAILMNGPKLSGKDTFINHMQHSEWGEGVEEKADLHRMHVECKDTLHDLTQQLFLVDSERYWDLYDDREMKETPVEDFVIAVEEYNKLCAVLGYDLPKDEEDFNTLRFLQEVNSKIMLSIREAIIYVSECVVKPALGGDYFGRARANLVLPYGGMVLDASAAAFEDKDGNITCDEIAPLAEKIGGDNILVLRIHRDGCTFDGDSRRYIPDGVVANIVDIDNNGTLEEFFSNCEKAIEIFLASRAK